MIENPIISKCVTSGNQTCLQVSNNCRSPVCLKEKDKWFNALFVLNPLLKAITCNSQLY